MANYQANQMLVAVKAYTRGNPLSLDASEVWESLSEAQTYAASAIAYAGQTIKAKLEDGKYHTYTLQPSDAGYTLEEINTDVSSSIKQYVVIGTRPSSGQEEGVIYIDENVGYIWNGSDWTKIFENVTTVDNRLDTVEEDLDTKAPTENPVFTGTVTVNGSNVATEDWVNSLIGQLNNGIPGIVDGDTPIPSTDYSAGQMWRVAVAGTYVGQTCEVGDLIICLKDYEAGTASNSDFMVVQANIDGAVTGAASSVDGHIVVFNGSTGKVIKDSQVTIASLNDAIAKAHEHTNKTQLDTYTMTQTELLAEASSDVTTQLSTVKSELEADIALKANSADVYTKTDIDSQLSTITQNLNTKVDSATVDSKISTATTTILETVEERVGEIPEGTSIKEYVDTAVGTGGTDSAAAIAQAKAEAIQESKNYTDDMLTIAEF